MGMVPRESGCSLRISLRNASRICSLASAATLNTEYGVDGIVTALGCIHHVAPAMSGTWSIRRMILQR
jgi:hypothetical protein